MLDRIKVLCREKGTTIYRLEQDTGIGNGTIGRWDNSTPKIDTLKKVADYFGVTIDDLLSEENAQ